MRFLPDYMVINIETRESWFFEYKVTRTPCYSEGDKQWSMGQIEANAWENYTDLYKIGVKVVITVFCPYYHRPLLAFFPDDPFVIRGKTNVKQSFGSGTPYVNIDLDRAMWFHDFIGDELGISKEIVCSLLGASFWDGLKSNDLLKVKFHPRAPEKFRKKEFFWENPCAGVVL